MKKEKKIELKVGKEWDGFGFNMEKGGEILFLSLRTLESKGVEEDKRDKRELWMQ